MILANQLSVIKDHEDACVVASTLNYGIKTLITRNKKDFKHSSLPLYLTEEALVLIPS